MHIISIFFLSVNIKIPHEFYITVYRDVNVPKPFKENLAEHGDDGKSQRVAEDDHIYMDAMAFGMGCCCLQVTFQASNIREARTLYDQLTPLCPIMVKSHCK